MNNKRLSKQISNIILILILILGTAFFLYQAYYLTKLDEEGVVDIIALESDKDIDLSMLEGSEMLKKTNFRQLKYIGSNTENYEIGRNNPFEKYSQAVEPAEEAVNLSATSTPAQPEEVDMETIVVPVIEPGDFF